MNWTLDDGTQKKWIRYSGNLPTKLYRYRSVSRDTIDRIINFEILEGGVFLAGIKDLNDPDEFRFILKFDGSRDEIFKYWSSRLAKHLPDQSKSWIAEESARRTEIVVSSGFRADIETAESMRHIFGNVVRVACFTTDPLNYSMWANYAKYSDSPTQVFDHAGICIEFNCDEKWREQTLHPIQYGDDIPQINVLSGDETSLVSALHSKGREWRAEQEWRITAIIQAMPPFPTNLATNAKMKFENSVVGVIFGLRAPDNLVKQILERVRVVNPGIKFRRVTSDVLTCERKLVDLP